MASEVDEFREMAKAYWAGNDPRCPKHQVAMKGEFVRTTYFDHLVLQCPRGKETYTIPQRPRQMQFNPHQVEGLVCFLQQGDNILCFRCQSRLQVFTDENLSTGVTHYTFTCVRCFSWGTWTGKPEESSIVGVTEDLEAGRDRTRT